jgi:hypothetical protein
MLLLLSCTFNITTHRLRNNTSLSLSFTLNDSPENKEMNPDRPSGIRTRNKQKSLCALNRETSGSAHNNLTTLRCFRNQFTLSVPFPMQFYFKHCSKYENVLHVKAATIGNMKRLFERVALKKSVMVVFLFLVILTLPHKEERYIISTAHRAICRERSLIFIIDF